MPPNNKTEWQSHEILDATKGQTIVTLSDWIATGASIYSFKVKPGDLFILLFHHRQRWDFVQEAFQRGAAGALLTCPANSDYNGLTTLFSKEELGKCIFVENSNEALMSFGIHASRSNTSCTKIAITGSVGKTSTKEGLAQILIAISHKLNKRVHYNWMNYNNEIGVSLTLIEMPREGGVDYCIFEMGMSSPGQIRTLIDMVQPTIVVITKIGESHLSRFTCVEGIVDAKCEIFESNLDTEGKSRGITAIWNRDDDDAHNSRILAHAAKNQITGTQIVTFGEHPESTIRLLNYEMTPNETNIRMKYMDQLYEYSVGQPGRARIWNSLAILAVVSRLLPLQLKEAMDEFKCLKSVSGRGAIHNVEIGGDGQQDVKQITIIDDSYNASPTSMKCGLETLGLMNAQSLLRPDSTNSTTAKRNRKIAVLGDMMDLGAENEILYHLKLKSILEANQIDLVFACGRHMNKLYDSLDMRMKGGSSANNSNDLIPLLMNTVEDGDILYIKGSHDMRMELILEAFVGEMGGH